MEKPYPRKNALFSKELEGYQMEVSRAPYALISLAYLRWLEKSEAGSRALRSSCFVDPLLSQTLQKFADLYEDPTCGLLGCKHSFSCNSCSYSNESNEFQRLLMHFLFTFILFFLVRLAGVIVMMTTLLRSAMTEPHRGTPYLHCVPHEKHRRDISRG